MKLCVNNLEYNLIKKRLNRLKEAYSQSNDDDVLRTVKDQVYTELAIAIDKFDDSFSKDFDACKMSGLKEIEDLITTVNSNVIVQDLPRIELSSAKKILKQLSEKQLNAFVQAYNGLKTPVTYYSKRFDDKLAIILPQDGTFIGVVAEIRKGDKQREQICAFCNNFRKGDEIGFVSNKVTSRKDEYRALGLLCCLDGVLCNTDILDTQKLISFISYKA